MVDLATLHALLRRVPSGARILLIGDDRQLPPVSFGLIFHRIVSDPSVTERLMVVHRQTDKTGIPAAASQIRSRKLPQFPVYSGLQDGVSLLPAFDAAAIAAGVLRSLDDLAGEDVLTIAPTHEGPSGTRILNRMLHDQRARPGKLEMSGPLGRHFSVGDPVVHERNDYRRGLFNGSLGRVSFVDPDAGILRAAFDDGEQQFTRAELIDLALGYVLTCHRAQGSQAARVVVALTPSRLLDPSWLYTAVTRAERQVVLVGDEDVLQTALARPWAADTRRIGFEWPAKPLPSP